MKITETNFETIIPKGLLGTELIKCIKMKKCSMAQENKELEKLKLKSVKIVREYWSEYTRISIELYSDDLNECILTHLYTLENYRQQGYAKKALAEAELIAKKLGCHIIYLKVETNSWMHNWYLRCGYSWYENTSDNYTWLMKSI